MDSCFVHSNESIHLYYVKSISKHCFEIVIRSRLWSTVSKRSTHLADSFFILNCSCKIEITVPCDMPVKCLNKLVHFHSSISQNNIVDFINDFWAASIGYLERGASHVDVQPRLNSFSQLYTSQTLVQICYEHYPLRFWFLSALNLSYRCLITARNSFFSILHILQRLFALIIYRNETTQWIPFKIWQLRDATCQKVI